MCSIRKCIRKCIGKGSLHNSAGCKDSRVSLGLTLLPLSLDSRPLSFYWLGDNIGISIAVWVESMVSIGVWEVVVSIGHSCWGLDLNSLDDRLNIGIVKSIGVGVVKSIGEIVGISLWISLSFTLLPLSLDSRLLSFYRLNIGIVKSIGVGVMKTIGEIVRISLWISLGLSLTLLPLSLDSRLLISNGSSSRENNWESVSPETIVVSIWDMSIGDNWSSLNLSGLYFNRLDNRQMRDSMVSSIYKRSSVEKKLRISLSSDSSNEGNHQQELHVVIAM